MQLNWDGLSEKKIVVWVQTEGRGLEVFGDELDELVSGQAAIDELAECCPVLACILTKLVCQLLLNLLRFLRHVACRDNQPLSPERSKSSTPIPISDSNYLEIKVASDEQHKYIHEATGHCKLVEEHLLAHHKAR
jgi:hypothetical protein